MAQEFRKKGSSPKKDVDFQQDLQEALLRFKSAFALFECSKDEQNRKYYFDVMNNELAMMDKIAKSIERKGIRKQESILSKDAKIYMNDQSLENQKKLQQDITTLSEVNQRPYK